MSNCSRGNNKLVKCITWHHNYRRDCHQNAYNFSPYRVSIIQIFHTFEFHHAEDEHTLKQRLRLDIKYEIWMTQTSRIYEGNTLPLKQEAIPSMAHWSCTFF